MKTSNFDWTYFKRRIYIKNTTRKELFRKWTTTQGIIEWFIAYASYKDSKGRVRAPEEIVQSGDTYFWRFHTPIDEITCKGSSCSLLRQEQYFAFRTCSLVDGGIFYSSIP